ncbi:hypothetical protein OAP63_04525 [Vibrio sp.]|nr:hypothetical protein [Vibrio sp.]
MLLTKRTHYHTAQSALYCGVLLSFLCPLESVGADLEPEVSGQINIENRYFFMDGDDDQRNNDPSIVLAPQFDWALNDADITFIPFYRYDNMDNERSHFDIRELKFLTYQGDYEVRIGINKVFWGVTESEHLVDVINQTDYIEAIDGEDKLGQPMVQFTAIKSWGTAEAYLLPYFRERTFSGRDGRLRTQLPINTDQPIYESNQKQKHLDFAFRYSNTLSNWDIGMSYFQGTDRTPYIIYQSGQLLPYYAQMKSFGLDVQGATGNWLWKLEAIHKDSYQQYTATASGFEYTWVGAFNTGWDLGLLSEYLYDSRGDESQDYGQNDIFTGLRISFNDLDSSTLLIGMTHDLDNTDVRLYKIEASKRLTNHLNLSIDAWAEENNTQTDPLYSMRNDDYLEVALEYYF